MGDTDPGTQWQHALCAILQQYTAFWTAVMFPPTHIKQRLLVIYKLFMRQLIRDGCCLAVTPFYSFHANEMTLLCHKKKLKDFSNGDTVLLVIVPQGHGRKCQYANKTAVIMWCVTLSFLLSSRPWQKKITHIKSIFPDKCRLAHHTQHTSSLLMIKIFLLQHTASLQVLKTKWHGSSFVSSFHKLPVRLFQNKKSSWVKLS